MISFASGYDPFLSGCVSGYSFSSGAIYRLFPLLKPQQMSVAIL